VGHLYLDGRGLTRDRTLAYRYYLKAAEQQHERAMSLVGRCCEEGWGTPRDLDAAADWYRRSAEAGYFRGQYNWASLLLKAGRFDEAATWFERAALGGTAAVRRAVVELISRAGAPRALRGLATRLKAGRLAPAGS
jgi:TPR repeat protein